MGKLWFSFSIVQIDIKKCKNISNQKKKIKQKINVVCYINRLKERFRSVVLKMWSGKTHTYILTTCFLCQLMAMHSIKQFVKAKYWKEPNCPARGKMIDRYNGLLEAVKVNAPKLMYQHGLIS